MISDETLIGREAMELEGAAEWREREATECPDHARNAEAARLLTTLAEELRLLEGTHVATDFERWHDSVFDDPKLADDGIQVVTAWSEYRRAIGFREFPTSAEDYLDRLMDIARDAAA